MRNIGSMLILLLMCGSLFAAQYDRYRTDLSLDELSADRFEQAARLLGNQEYSEAYELIRDCDSEEPYHILLKLDILYRLARYQEYIDTVHQQSREFQETFFPRYIYWYLQSCFALDCKLEDVKGSFREFDRLHTLKQMVELKRIFTSLFLNGNFEQVSSLLSVMPDGLFEPDEAKLIQAVALYFQNRFDEAVPLLDALASDSSAPIPTIAADYLSLIAIDTGNETRLPQDISVLSEDALIRFILFFIDRNRYDTVSQLELYLPYTNSSNLCRTLIAFRQKRYQTADEFMRRMGESFIYNSALSSLAKGELDYRFKRYESAVGSFKRFRELQSHSENYANFALGWAYHGFYKYNSSAFYWMKNLDADAPWGSLANRNLATLYTHTKHHEIARKYFRNMARYSENLDHKFLIQYIDNLVSLSYYKTLESETLRFRNRLTPLEFDRYTRILGDYYYEAGQYEKAKALYEMMETEGSGEVHYREEHAKYQLGEYENTEDFLRNYIAQYPKDPRSLRISYDLIAYYLEQAEYNQLIPFTDSLLVNQIGNPDSIHYFQAVAYYGSGKDSRAVSLLKALIARGNSGKDETDYLKQNALELLERISLRLDVKQVSDIYSNLIAELHEDDIDSLVVESDSLDIFFADTDTLQADSTLVFDRALYRSLLESLARIYEYNKLYQQANDIYCSFFDDTTRVDTTAILMKVAKNQIYMRAFKAAWSTLDSIAVHDPIRYAGDLLFLRHAIKYGEKDYSQARKYLFQYYWDYNEEALLSETYRTLAELYLMDDQPLPAWYFFRKTTQLPDYRDNYDIEKHLSRLKKEIGEDTLKTYPPRDYENFLYRIEKLLP